MRLIAVLALLAVPLASCGARADPVTAAPSGDGTGTLIVANKREGSLSRIDLATGEETHRADTCENPHELTVSPDETLVMVACYSGRTLEIYATGDLERAREIELGENARVHSALWLGNGDVLAGAEGRGSLYFITGAAAPSPDIVEIGGGGQGPHLLAVSPDERTAWGSIVSQGEVVRYDLESGEEAARRRISEDIEAIALTPDGESLWVASNAEAAAWRLDPATLETQAEVAVGNVPIRLAAHPSGDWVVTSNLGSGDLTVIDTATDAVARTVALSGGQAAGQVTLVFSENGSRLYAAETFADTIAEIDFASGDVLRRLPAGPGGDGLAVLTGSDGRDLAAELRATAEKCGAEPGQLRIVDGTARFSAPASAEFEQISCVFDELKARGIPTLQGYVGTVR